MSTDDLMPDFVGILHVLANTDRLSDNERWACSRGAIELRKAEAQRDRLIAQIEDAREATEPGRVRDTDARLWAVAAEVRAEIEDRHGT